MLAIPTHGSNEWPLFPITGVTMHRGQTIESGHSETSVHTIDNRWFHYDDGAIPIQGPLTAKDLKDIISIWISGICHTPNILAENTWEPGLYFFLAVRIAESLSQLTAGWESDGWREHFDSKKCVRKKKPNSAKSLALFGPRAGQGRAWTWRSHATQNGGDETRILAAAKASWVVWFMLALEPSRAPGSEPWLELSQCRLQNLFTHNVLPRPGMKFQAQNLRIEDRSSCEFGWFFYLFQAKCVSYCLLPKLGSFLAVFWPRRIWGAARGIRYKKDLKRGST